MNKRLGLLLRLIVPTAALAYLLTVVPIGQLMASITAVSPLALLVGILTGATSMLVAALRWRMLFSACGIATRVSVLSLFRLHMIGLYYNSYLPGGLGGDVVRALATKGLFGERGMSGALAVILLERTLGLSGLLILVAVSFSLFPLEGIPNVMLWSAVGLCAATGAVAAIILGRRLAPYLPGSLARLARTLPTIVSAPQFAGALGLSVATQSLGIVLGHVILSSITDRASWTDSLVVMPLIGAAQYFPLTVGGAGVREAAFVLFYGLVGVSKPDALASSLVCAAVIYLVAAMGGVLHALRPLSLAPDGSS